MPKSVAGSLPFKRITLLAFWLMVGFAFIYPFTLDRYTVGSGAFLREDLDTIPDFSAYTQVKEKKRAFFAYLLPEIEKQNENVLEERHIILAFQQKLASGEKLSQQNKQYLSKLREKYKVSPKVNTKKSLVELLNRVDIIPPELVLVQAANESAWGTSRFATQGFNFFGLWCFKKGCGFVPSRRGEGAEHEVAKFNSLSHAVMTYIRNLNRHYAYKELRSIRKSLRDNQQPVTAEALVHGLMRYSERGQDYIDELNHMIQFNKKYMEI